MRKGLRLQAKWAISLEVAPKPPSGRGYQTHTLPHISSNEKDSLENGSECRKHWYYIYMFLKILIPLPHPPHGRLRLLHNPTFYTTYTNFSILNFIPLSYKILYPPLHYKGIFISTQKHISLCHPVASITACAG